MKKLQSLGFILCKQEMKKIVGGNYDGCFMCTCTTHGNFEFSFCGEGEFYEVQEQAGEWCRGLGDHSYSGAACH